MSSDTDRIEPEDDPRVQPWAYVSLGTRMPSPTPAPIKERTLWPRW